MKDTIIKSKVLCLGIMSGTSLDGLDICFVSFEKENDQWLFSILEAETISYDEVMRRNLSQVETMTGIELLDFNNSFGTYIGTQANRFCDKFKVNPQFIASHGHTIFHQPKRALTYQIGSGACIAAKTGITTVSDFRVLDVALGGQGAPLVPIGDELLFNRYEVCLNLGGFANLSVNIDGIRVAYDICPVNIVLNHYTRKIGKQYDSNGSIAAKAQYNSSLLNALNALSFYTLPYPKSLGKEWVLKEVLPLIDSFELSIPEILCTVCHHVAIQIARCVESGQSILVTGGGVYNSFLLSLLKNRSNATIVIPDDNTIQFKEALIFAFLGLNRINSEINCLQSVTGASRNCVGGSVFLGK
jgi:anhydro-N-acetylmuramic acid kinase